MMNTDIAAPETPRDPQLIIRRTGLSELPVIAALAYRIWPEAYGEIISETQISYMLEQSYAIAALERQFHSGNIFLIAFLQEEPVGFASYSSTPDPFVYKTHKLYVLPSIQKKGIGKAMLEAIFNNARLAGATAVQLNVNRNNKARFFYEKIGFRAVKEVDIPIGRDFFMNDYVMEKNISRGIISADGKE